MAHTIVIFGASGDLTSRKLIPALYSLFTKGRLPKQTRIVGVSRSQFEHQQWRDSLRDSVEKFAKELFDGETWNAKAAKDASIICPLCRSFTILPFSNLALPVWQTTKTDFDASSSKSLLARIWPVRKH